MRHGLLLVDKDPGMTSHDVVQRAREIFGQKKIGHCGTLDPDATGLLLLTMGDATRLTRFFIKAPKVYEGVIRLGIETDTYDADGEIVEQRPIDDVTREALEEAVGELTGEIDQLPPPYCAKKVDGKKYYELAREGEEVPQETKRVTVFEFEITGPIEDGEAPFRVACASGTYVRSLAHDVGKRLGCGGHLKSLRRTVIGDFRIEDGADLRPIADAVGEESDRIPGFIPFDDIPLPFENAVADAQQEERISHGQRVLMRTLTETEEGDWVKLVNRRNRFIAVGSIVERVGAKGVGVVQPKIVFSAS